MHVSNLLNKNASLPNSANSYRIQYTYYTMTSVCERVCVCIFLQPEEDTNLCLCVLTFYV